MGEEKYRFIEITERKCSPNLQKDIQNGQIYVVVGTDTLKDGTPVVIVNSREVKDKTSRVNANRFSWKQVTLEDFQEWEFKKRCQETSEQLRDNFTLKEQIQIAFVPCVLADLAFRYGSKVRKEAADLRISELKPLSRAYDALKDAYMDEISIDLDKKHIKKIIDQTSVFMELYSRDFQILWFSVNAELTKKYPDYHFREMRTDAICGMLIIDMSRQMISDLDGMIKERIHTAEKTIFNPKLAALKLLLDAYAGKIEDFDFNDKNCRLATKVIQNKILQIEFNV